MIKFPKPTPRASEKAKSKRQAAISRRVCILAVWLRAEGLCEECGRRVEQSSTNFKAVGHVHERVSRAQGGDPTDPANCVLLCYQCHFNGPSGAHRRSE